MQVCAPLRWPFPFVPFICKANEELLSSPIPIFGTMLDSQEVTLANGNPNSQFYSLWTKEAEASPTVHFQLDKNKSFGRCRVELKQFLTSTGYYKTLKELRKLILENIGEDFMLKNLYLPRYKVLIRLLGQFVDVVRDIVHDIYLKDLDFSLLIDDSPQTYAKVKEKILACSQYNRQAHAALLDSQAFQLFMESNLPPVSPKTV